MIHTQDADFTLHLGDCMEVLADLPDGSIDAVVTSPPYLDARPEYDGPRDFEYGQIFYELSRVISGGMLWNVGRLWRDGSEQLWWLELIRQAKISGWQHWDTAVWVKPNANPIHGRVFANSHEYVLVFGRDGVLFNEDGIRVPHAESTRARFGRGWTNHKGVKNPIASKARKIRVDPNPLGGRPRSYVVGYVGGGKGNKHPAPMTLEIAGDLVSLATLPGQTVLDPFAGSGTTLLAARNLGRNSVGIEKHEDYANDCARRLGQQSLLAGIA